MIEVPIAAQSIDRYRAIAGDDQVAAGLQAAARAREHLKGRVVWNISSTAHGGGVAEMLHTLLPYVRGLGIDIRWLVIEAPPEFFHFTKRLHHALHGEEGDGGELGDAERKVYEAAILANAAELAGRVQRGDFVILHDPQTAGLAPELMRGGARVIWRCHVGADEANKRTAEGWGFLEPYLRDVPATVFSRRQYVPDFCDDGRSTIIPPAIDPFSPKNQDLDDATVRAILVHTGLIEGPVDHGQPIFTRSDGSPGRVDRQADITRLGRASAWDTPLVIQVGRWDPLKDPVGVMEGFASLLDEQRAGAAELLLAGPNVTAIADDPEAGHVLDGVIARWRALPHGHRGRVHLACLPMADDEENAAIVNALQRHASVVVQKSIKEGFGLTVTEAMWKARAVIGSAVGGIQDQIEDGVSGLLLRDPRDRSEFAGLLKRLVSDPSFAQGLGETARERAREHFLGLRQLLQYGDLLERLQA